MKKVISILSVIVLAVALSLSLVACMPSNPADAEKNLKDAGYDTFVIESGSLEARTFALLVEGFDAMVMGTSEDDGILIFYFDDSNAAKAFYEDGVESMLTLFELSEDDLGEDNQFEFKQSGKVVYYGTKAGIKAAK